ncbi:hypothetical protein [Nocardia sp. XZ_19_385]|uniref:hypothetical protein n=2 Tax=Nocardia sp. XZ_19_385 TaxID=2769488 RepID=UPI001E60C84F|nr:hypothetical protein [Nocardia sp. XZ_19_385]
MMGAYSTTPLRAESEAADPAATAPSQPQGSKPPQRLSTILSRTFAWLFFIGGVVGAALGIAGLHVEIAVAGLILACTAGLVLLKLRHDRGVRAETD